MVLNLNLEWADLGIGFYVYDNRGYEMSFVVDGQDRTIYASVEDKRADLDAFKTLSHGIRALVDKARASPPLPSVGILRAGDDIALVGASAITPEENADFCCHRAHSRC